MCVKIFHVFPLFQNSADSREAGMRRKILLMEVTMGKGCTRHLFIIIVAEHIAAVIVVCM